MPDASTSPLLEQEIAIGAIHADPVQPRIHPDAELAESIRSQGILQAITIEPIQALDVICPDCGRTFIELAEQGGHFLIMDGERRYRGAIAAGLKTVLAKIILPTSEAERLLRQLTSNTGKPLTPTEEAFAFKRLMEAKGWTQAELARKLGRARSVVGDRIRLVELDPAWLEAIGAGKLQVSHAPVLSTFSAVPSEYQKKAAAILFDDYRAKRYLEGGGSIPVDELPRLLYVAFRDFIKETSHTPGYRGPTIEIKSEYGGKKKYAADIAQWRPCFRAYEKKERKARSSGGGLTSYSSNRGAYLSAPQKAVKALKAAGFDPPLRKVGNTRVLPEKGETIIHNEQGWPNDLHPKVLLAKLDPSTITYVKGNYGGDELYTSDVAAVTAAREAYRQHVANVAEKELAPLRKALTGKVIAEHQVTGPGSIHLLAALNPERGQAKVVALALGLTVAGGITTDGPFFDDDDEPLHLGGASAADAERLLSALAAVKALAIDVPDDWRIGQLIRKGISDVPFKVSKATKVVKVAESLGVDVVKTVSANDPRPEHKSKKQQKRADRAAGKPVGDPSRAPQLPKVGRAPDGSVTLSTPREEARA